MRLSGTKPPAITVLNERKAKRVRNVQYSRHELSGRETVPCKLRHQPPLHAGLGMLQRITHKILKIRWIDFVKLHGNFFIRAVVTAAAM